jgi:hypothetical protein
MITPPLQLIKESLFVGMLTILFGFVASFIISRSPLKPQTGHWNKYHAMEVSLALTGILVHLFCEFSGLNSYYVNIKK